MERSPSWENNRFSVSQEIPCILWKQKTRYRIHKSPPSVPILSQINQIDKWTHNKILKHEVIWGQTIITLWQLPSYLQEFVSCAKMMSANCEEASVFWPSDRTAWKRLFPQHWKFIGTKAFVQNVHIYLSVTVCADGRGGLLTPHRIETKQKCWLTCRT